jgi:hypothetical protein
VRVVFLVARCARDVVSPRQAKPAATDRYALAYFLYYWLIAEAGATRSALITYVNPAVAALLGVLVLGEPLTWATLIGFVLIVFGCALATGVLSSLRARRRPRKMPGADPVATGVDGTY